VQAWVQNINLKGEKRLSCGLFGIVLAFAVQFERLSLITMFFD